MNDETPRAEVGRTFGRKVGLVIGVFVIAFFAFAYTVLRVHTRTEPGPLPVRTDLMRGAACHVADDMIMGECTSEEIARFQREARAALR